VETPSPLVAQQQMASCMQKYAANAIRSIPVSKKILDTGGRVSKFEKRYGKAGAGK